MESVGDLWPTTVLSLTTREIPGFPQRHLQEERPESDENDESNQGHDGDDRGVETSNFDTLLEG